MSGRKLAALVVVALGVLVSLIWLVGGAGMMGWGTGSGMMGWSGYGFSGWGIMMLFVAALVIGGVVWLGASPLSPRRGAATVPVAVSAEPLDILKERYARGELGREEYDRVRKELER